MMLYGLKFRISKKVEKEKIEDINKELLQLVDEYKIKCEDKQFIDVSNKQEIFVISNVNTFAKDFLQDANIILEKYNIICEIKVSLTGKHHFQIRNIEGEDDIDAFDYMRDMVNLEAGLFQEAYLVNKIGYMYMKEEILFDVTIEVFDFEKMNVGIISSLSSKEGRERGTKVIEFLEKEFQGIVNTIDNGK